MNYTPLHHCIVCEVLEAADDMELIGEYLVCINCAPEYRSKVYAIEDAILGYAR